MSYPNPILNRVSTGCLSKLTKNKALSIPLKKHESCPDETGCNMFSFASRNMVAPNKEKLWLQWVIYISKILPVKELCS